MAICHPEEGCFAHLAVNQSGISATVPKHDAEIPQALDRGLFTTTFAVCGNRYTPAIVKVDGGTLINLTD
jgi:hypothetical protein